MMREQAWKRGVPVAECKRQACYRRDDDDDELLLLLLFCSKLGVLALELR